MIAESFASLSTPLIADACLRLGIELRQAPPGIVPVVPGMRVAGPALPVRHAGSVDVFLEAFERAGPGDVLVIDNGGLLDEGCIGDLTVLEARSAGVAGLIVWGAHRDTAELRTLDVPVFSYGTRANGPLAARERDAEALASARCGDVLVTPTDIAFADEDGVVFAPADRSAELIETAREIAESERRQAALVRDGTTLRAQLRFVEYLKARDENPALTFREHLRAVGGEIEE